MEAAVTLTNARVAQLVVQRGQPSSSITMAPPDGPAWTLVEAQLFGVSGDGGPFEALCTSYTYVTAARRNPSEYVFLATVGDVPLSGGSSPHRVGQRCGD